MGKSLVAGSGTWSIPNYGGVRTAFQRKRRVALAALRCGKLAMHWGLGSSGFGSQQSSRARRELSQRAALRPRPAWPAPPPSWPLLAVCAAAHMQARGALRTLAPIQCLPPCLYAFRRGARDDARGSSRSSSCWSRASSSHSFHGAWATDAMATRRWNSGGAILPGSDADARVDVGGVGGLAR